MKNRHLVVSAALSAFLVLGAPSPASAAYYTDSIGGGIGQTPEGYTPNDDESFGPYLLGFNVEYFGADYRSVVINNNGTLVFGRTGYSAFTPSDIRTMTLGPSLAPFWADVDTRAGGGGVFVRNDTPDQFIVTWDNVGYFSQRTELRNSFQLVLRGAGYDVPEGEGNVGFFYGDMQWETGGASDGVDGFGGNPAVAGFGDGRAGVDAAEVLLPGSGANGIAAALSGQSFWFNVNLGDGIANIGEDQSSPFLPDLTTPNGPEGTDRFTFVEVPSGRWFDPPIARGFDYAMTGGSVFTAIDDFPTGFNQPFDVYANNALVGSFAPGQRVDFVALLGAGVSSFRIDGIDPLADPSLPDAFPLALSFDTPTASFTMTAVLPPLVASEWLGGVGDWSDPAQWSTDPAFPQNNLDSRFDVTVNGGTLTLDLDVALQSATFNGGLLRVTEARTLDANTTINSLTVGGGGTLTLADTTTLGAAPSGSQILRVNGGGTEVVNTGTFNQSTSSVAGGNDHSGTIILNANSQSGTASTFRNAVGGTFNSVANGQDNPGIGGISADTGQPALNRFVNEGLFVKSGDGLSRVTSGVGFENAGTVDVQGGELELNGGDNGATTGDFTVAAGATLHLQNGDYTFGGETSVSGGGELEVSNGTTNFLPGSNLELGELTVNGGTLNVNAGVTGSGSLSNLAISFGTLETDVDLVAATAQLTGGTLTGAGAVTFTGAVEIDNAFTSGGTGAKTFGGTTTLGSALSGSGELRINGMVAQVVNTGTFNQSSSYDPLVGGYSTTIQLNSIFQSGTANTFRNAAGGTFNSVANGTDSAGINAITAFNNQPTLNRFVNEGLFVKSGDGLSRVTSGVGFENAGTVDVQAGRLELSSVAQRSGDVLTDGTWIVSGSGELDFADGGPDFSVNQADVTLDGNAASFARILTVTDNQGALRLLGGRDFTAAAAFTNSGVLALAGGTFTAPALVNSGTISGFGSVAVRPTNSAPSSGSVVASGGTLEFTDGIGGSGEVRLEAASTLDVSGGASGSQAVFLLHNGASLVLGANDFTVTGDYVNGGWGEGNTFNPRAGVSGSGRLLAGGGTAQSITGARVAGGTTTTPTLALGNIHVGDTTSATFAIANASAGGADLRGALQTTVNGGNLTDVRLGGSGTVAGNYGPVAAGAATATYQVTFTGTQAGALASQAVRIATNFDNVAGQTLALTGAAYGYAAADSLPTSVDLGTVRVGTDPAALRAALAIVNVAAADGFHEALNASVTSLTGPFSAQGAITGLAAGAASAAISIGADTSVAGDFAGSATLAFASNGVGSSGLGVTALASRTVNYTATVNALAAPVLSLASGAGELTGGGLSYSLDLGVLDLSGGPATATLSLANLVVGPADALGGLFLTDEAGAFNLDGFSAFDGLFAGDVRDGLVISFEPDANGEFSGRLTFLGASQNAFQSDHALAPVEVLFSATVVPEPTTWALVALSGLAVLLMRRRRR